MRVAVVGVSLGQTCGVREHARLLADALDAQGTRCSTHWLTRSRDTLGGARSEIGRWTAGLGGELDRSEADAILLHYSVFSYSYKGLPLFVVPVMSALRRSGLPIVSVMHELAFPWRKAGMRGEVWAITQRAALVDVVRGCSGIVLTADFRVRWLQTRRWLPERALALAPVFSNLPAPNPAARPDRDGARLGLFGYRYDDAAIGRVLDALLLLRAQRADVRLSLLGGPGATSTSGASWTAAARRRGLERAVSFSGTLPAQRLADELAACDVLLFADTPGPSSRKGTLAGSLASGRPLVASEGHRGWPELARARAARIVPRSPEALAAAVAELLADEAERDRLGARGRAFAEREMGIGRTVDAVSAMLTLATVGPRRGA
jgi:glycosyltransferase involved in cell wall biosynthesis